MAERFCSVQPGRHVVQDAHETQLVLWGQLGRGGEVDVCPTLEPDVCAHVRAKGKWSCNKSWIFDGNGLEEGQDVVTIVCDGGQRLGDGLIFLTWFCQLHVVCIDGYYAIVVVVLVCLNGGFLFLCPLRDGAGKNLQEIARVRLPVEDCSLREDWQGGNDIARSPVPLLLIAREVAGDGANEDFCDQETDIIVVRGKGDFDLQENYRR